LALSELPADHDIGHLKRSLQFVKGFDTAIDCGAHKGIWTKEMMKHFKKVMSFEPVYSNYQFLETINPDYSWQLAIGGKDGFTDMKAGTENTGQYHMVEGDEIPVVTLDSFEIPNVDFIKFDVEGMELFAIQGALVTILECRPLILIEENGLCSRYNVKDGEAGQYLEALGYKMIKRMNKDYLYEHSPR